MAHSETEGRCWLLGLAYTWQKMAKRYTLKVYPFGPLYHFGTTFFILPFCSRNRKDKRENHKQGYISLLVSLLGHHSNLKLPYLRAR
jgi:hypothetical protein